MTSSHLKETSINSPEMPHPLIQRRVFLLGLLLVPTLVFAAEGIPMILIAMPIYVMAFIPMVLIESYFIATRLNFNFITTLKTAIVANIVSIFIGIPIAWGVLLGLQHLVGTAYPFGNDFMFAHLVSAMMQAPWVFTEHPAKVAWVVQVAFVTLALPFYFVSWWLEYKIFTRRLLTKTPFVSRVIRHANLVSFFLVIVAKVLYDLYVGSGTDQVVEKYLPF